MINVLNIRQFVLRIRKGCKIGKNVPLSETLYMSIRECLNELGQYQRAILCHPFICYPAWNFCLKKPEILGFGMRNSPQWIRNPADDWNPKSLKFHWQRIRNPVPGIWNPQRGIQNPRLSYLTWSDKEVWSLNVSAKLPTYPSSKPTLTLTYHLGQNVA